MPWLVLLLKKVKGTYKTALRRAALTEFFLFLSRNP